MADPHCRLVTDLTRTTRAARTRTHPVRHEADSRRADARHATDVHLRSVRPTARPAKVRHNFDRGARAPQGHASGPSQATAGRGRDTVRVTSDQMTWVFFRVLLSDRHRGTSASGAPVHRSRHACRSGHCAVQRHMRLRPAVSSKRRTHGCAIRTTRYLCASLWQRSRLMPLKLPAP